MSIGSKETQMQQKADLEDVLFEIEKENKRWINCCDELPEDYDDYLTSYKGSISISHFNQRGWSNANRCKVEYWRELPEAP